MAPEDVARRRAAKRFNERLKLFGTFLNNTGIATLAGGLVLPLTTGSSLVGDRALGVLSAAVITHMFAQLWLTFLRSEKTMDPYNWLLVAWGLMMLFGAAMGLWLWRQSVLLDRRFGRDPR